MKICIFGSASNDIGKSYIEEGEKLGYELSKRGHSLVFGAGKFGMMGASARGMKKNNAEVIGVIPDFFDEMGAEVKFEEADKIIQTKTMAERKTIMESLCDAFIITPGGIGTMEEFFEVITLKQLSRHTKPIVILNINKYYDSIFAFLEHAYNEKFIKRKCEKLFYVTEDIFDAINYIENYVPEQLDIKEIKNG